MSINGLTIAYSDGIKTADYAPPRTVALTANVDPAGHADHEALIRDVLDMLRRRTHSALHGVELTERPTVTTAAPASPQPEPEAPKAPRAPRKPKETAASGGETKPTSSAGGEQTSGADAGFEEPIQPTETGDEWDTPAQAEVTDAQLIEAVTKKNGELQAAGLSKEEAPVKIRELIATYNPDPSKAFAIREIPQDKRGDFLAKLAKITK